MKKRPKKIRERNKQASVSRNVNRAKKEENEENRSIEAASLVAAMKKAISKYGGINVGVSKQ